MLKHIKVTNFRSLDNFSMDFNEGLNVIIGKHTKKPHRTQNTINSYWWNRVGLEGKIRLTDAVLSKSYFLTGF